MTSKLIVSLIALCALIVGCGGDSKNPVGPTDTTTTPPAAQVVISPADSTTVDFTETLSFSATLNIADKSVVWTTTVGQIDQNGHLSGLTAGTTGTVKACSKAYATACSSTIVKVVRKDLIVFDRLDTILSNGTTGVSGVYVANTSDATSSRQVNSTGFFSSWMPDGKTVAYVSMTGTSPNPNSGRLCLVSYTGAGQHCITPSNMGVLDHVSSPDGTRIAFQYFENDAAGNLFQIGVATIDITGANLRHVTAAPCSGGFCLADGDPSWSPDGKSVFVNHGDNFYRMSPDSEYQAFVQKNNVSNTSASQITMRFSPDGKKKAFAERVGSVFQVFVENVDNAGNSLGGRLQITHGTESAAYPSWSPDGKQLAYEAGDDSRIYIANVDGSGSPRRLTNSTLNNRTGMEKRPSWRP